MGRGDHPVGHLHRRLRRQSVPTHDPHRLVGLHPRVRAAPDELLYPVFPSWENVGDDGAEAGRTTDRARRRPCGSSTSTARSSSSTRGSRRTNRRRLTLNSPPCSTRSASTEDEPCSQPRRTPLTNRLMCTPAIDIGSPEENGSERMNAQANLSVRLLRRIRWAFPTAAIAAVVALAVTACSSDSADESTAAGTALPATAPAVASASTATPAPPTERPGADAPSPGVTIDSLQVSAFATTDSPTSAALSTTISNGWVAFAAGDESDIYLVREGSPAHRIAGSDTDRIEQVCPAFSPDGTRLMYAQATGDELRRPGPSPCHHRSGRRWCSIGDGHDRSRRHIGPAVRDLVRRWPMGRVRCRNAQSRS